MAKTHPTPFQLVQAIKELDKILMQDNNYLKDNIDGSIFLSGGESIKYTVMGKSNSQNKDNCYVFS
jgi:hypothetical protein